jgi:hypothetical protein
MRRLLLSILFVVICTTSLFSRDVSIEMTSYRDESSFCNHKLIELNIKVQLNTNLDITRSEFFAPGINICGITPWCIDTNNIYTCRLIIYLQEDVNEKYISLNMVGDSMQKINLNQKLVIWQNNECIILAKDTK